jgi:hypothetical protein
MAKHFLFAVMMTISLASLGQTTKPKLEQVKNDPKTTENAAKADVQTANKKNVTNNAGLKSSDLSRVKKYRKIKNKNTR